MPRSWILAPVLAGALAGCGGSSDVQIAKYDATSFSIGTSTSVTKIESSGAQDRIIGQTDGLAFMSTVAARGVVPYANQLGPAEDIVADVSGDGDIVGYDSSTTGGQVGLAGNQASFVPNTLGFTLTTEYLRYFAVSADGVSIGVIRYPTTGAATAVRHSGGGNTALTNFTDFSPQSIAGINNAGKVCGTGSVLTQTHAFMSVGTDLIDLGEGTARGMNEAGIVVGKNQNGRPYRTKDAGSSTRTALPLLPGFTFGEALDINSAGVVVGWQSETELSPHVPVAWYANGALVDLRSRINLLPAGVDLLDAVSISDSGAILVQGDQSGTPVGVILRQSD